MEQTVNKTCVKCTNEFEPTSPNQKRCPACRIQYTKKTDPVEPKAKKPIEADFFRKMEELVVLAAQLDIPLRTRIKIYRGLAFVEVGSVHEVGPTI